ncbi:Dos2-interacting transcription regulator of RNA-Pol-II-domain-containing protein [Leptodontidium sp. MPI-SDFR-AT-0119]|nr:Dos2-interacting transcription regulator of RNA-Pol-II-domain-containing protein [Leptodontidium sp. MPI-SDFR-AT-0119]
MPLFAIQDWIGAAHIGGGPTEKEEEIVTDYAGSIELTVYSVENLVKDLAPYIHSDEDLVAVARGLELLSRVLGRLAVEPSRHTAKYISDYLCSRLENVNRLPSFRAGIHEVASCLEILIRWNHFPPGESMMVASAIFSLSRQGRFKDLKPATRQILYLLVETLFKSRGDALLKSSTIPPLIRGLVGIAEFEKTPSCLGVLFQLYTYLSKEWDLEANEFQTLWDSFYRYWPVTVGGSTQQVSKPTSEELRDMLLECILSNDSYAKNSIPMCLEKLDTTHDLSAMTKNEVLATLAACIKAYSVPAVEPWSIKIWSSLKFEVWNGDIDDFIRASLKVFHALSSKLSQNSHDWTSTESYLALYVLPAATECKERLQDSKKQFTRSTGMILSSIASGSPYAFQLVFKEVLPSMNTIWQDLRLGSEKTLLLGVFNNLLVARLSLPDISNPGATYPASSTALLDVDTQNMARLTTDFAKFSQNLVDVYFGAFANSEASPASSPDPTLSVAAIKGLTLLFQIPGYLSTVEQGMIVQKLNDLATSPAQDAEVAKTVVESLQQICSIEPTVFRENTLLDFLQKLPKSISTDPEKSEHELDAVLGYLESLTEICCTVVCKKEVVTVPPVTAASSFWHRNFDAMVEKLLAKFTDVMSIGGQLPYAAALVATIANAITKFDKTLEGARITTQLPLLNDSTKGPYDYIILALFREIVVQKVDINGQLYVGLKPSSFGGDLDRLVRMVGRATMLAMRSKLTTPSNNLVLSWNRQFPKEPSAIWSLLTHTGDGLLATTQKNLQQGPPDKCLANILSMSLLAGMQPKSKDELRLPAGEVAAAMIHNSLNMPKDSSRACLESTHEMLQLLVNKFGAAKETLGDGTTLLDIVKKLVEDSRSAGVKQAAKVYQTLAYFTAASLAAFDPTLEPLIGLMIDGIKNPIFGRKVAQSFRILLAPSPILTKENFCAVRLLRNSKCFAVAVNPLITLWQTATDKALKENYLIAISGILVYMTPTQLDEGIPASRLLPIILEGVAVKDEQFAKTAFMKTLLHLTPRHPAIIEEHLDSVLNRVLDRLRNTYDSPSDCSIECRVLAGDVLILLVKLVKPALLLQRSIKINTELDSAKDDISGDVRRKVGECTMQWFNLSDRAK